MVTENVTGKTESEMGKVDDFIGVNMGKKMGNFGGVITEMKIGGLFC
jgi:hypothetical protein